MSSRYTTISCGIAMNRRKIVVTRDSRSGYATSNATGCGGLGCSAATVKRGSVYGLSENGG